MAYLRSSLFGCVMALAVTSTAAAATPDDVPPPPAPDSRDGVGVRAAVELAGGFFTLPTYRGGGGTFGIQGRIGARIAPFFAIAYQGGVIGMFLNHDMEDGDAQWKEVSFQNAALAVFTIADVIDLGLGPAVDFFIVGDDAYPVFDSTNVAAGGRTRVAAHVPIVAGAPALTFGWDTTLLMFPSSYDDHLAVGGAATAGVEWF